MWGLQTQENRDPLIHLQYIPMFCLCCSPQPSLSKRHPPFRLPQEHRLFERLREVIIKGELSQGPGAESSPLSTLGNFSLLHFRLYLPRPTLDPIQGGSSDPHLPAGRGPRGDLCPDIAGLCETGPGEAAREE